MADLEDVTLDGRPLQSLRVADLKAALEERGLPKSGPKNALIKRLKGALMLENLQRTSQHHIGLQPNSQIGEEMSQNSFIKQYLEKQQELLRQRLEREAREAVDEQDTDQVDHTQGNNSSACLAPEQAASPVLLDQQKRLGPSEVAGPASEVEDPWARDGHRACPSAPTSHTTAPTAVASLSRQIAVGGQQPERVPTSSHVPADSGKDSDGGDHDGQYEDRDSSGARRRNQGKPARGQLARERSGGSCQLPQHIPLLSPQLRQPTPPPSPPPELSFPLPDTPKQSPPSPGELPPRQRTSSTSSSGSSSSGRRSSSPEPQGNTVRKPGPLTLLARKMASEGAFSGVGWHGRGEAERKDKNAESDRGPQESPVSAITNTANAASRLHFPSLVSVTNHAVLGGPYRQVPVSVLRPSIMEDKDAWQQENRVRELQAERESEKALEQERLGSMEQEILRQRILEQQHALEKERKLASEQERMKALEAETKERIWDLERDKVMALERQRALETEQALQQERLKKERALELELVEREKALERERVEREALEQKMVERKAALELERLEKKAVALELERLEKEKALELERLEKEKALELERLEKEKALELERLEKEKALELERLEKEKALELERLEKEKALELERLEKEKALELERLEKENAVALELERLEKENAVALELERLEMEKALELERLEKEKALEQVRLEKENAVALERERLEKEKALELELLEKENAVALERERLEKEKALERERLEKEKALERERLEKEKALERERLEKEKALERERLEKEKALERERLEKEKALERERLEKEKALERERLEKEKALERERLEKEKALERERLEKEKALELERLEKEKALELERLEKEKALELERLEKEKALELERLEKEKALELERLEKENAEAIELVRLEKEKALELERLEKEKALELEMLEKEKALELEMLEKEKALELERLEKEKALERDQKQALERERMERDEALARERVDKEKALEQEKEQALELQRQEREKALKLERLKGEKALEHERIESERDLERVEMERVLELQRQNAMEGEEIKRPLEKDRKPKARALEQNIIERKEALEMERDMEKGLKSERALESESEEKSLQREKERAKLAERGSNRPWKRGHEIGLTSLPTHLLSTGADRVVRPEKGKELHVPTKTAWRDNQPVESGTPLSQTPLALQSIKKFSFIRDPPVLSPSSSASLVTGKPCTFPDSPPSQTSAVPSSKNPGDQQESHSQGPLPSPVTPALQIPKQLASEEHVQADEVETCRLAVRESAREAELGGVVYDSSVTAVPRPPPEEGLLVRRTDTSQKEKETSSSSDSSSSDSDSGSSCSASSSASQGEMSSTTSGRKPEKHKQITKCQGKEPVGQLNDSTEAAKVSCCTKKVSGEEKDVTLGGAKNRKKPFFEIPAREDNDLKVDRVVEKDTASQVEVTTKPDVASGSSEEGQTPKTFTARRISLISDRASTGVVSAEAEAGSGRKRRWGSSTAVSAKKHHPSLTTDFLKSLIPRPCPSSQEVFVDLYPEEVHLSGGEKVKVAVQVEQDLQIRRTVTQVVLSDTLENGQESKSREHDEEDRQDEKEVKGDKEKKLDVSLQKDAMETQPPSHNLDRSTVAPSDTLLRRSISQQKTSVSITIDDPVRSTKQPSPPRSEVSNIVHVSNLVRPFTLGQLKELLRRTGTILEETFWIDKIKSHCYVTYGSKEEALATRAALHGVKWPQSNPKFLTVDFSQQEELDFQRGLLAPERAGEEERGSAVVPGRGREAVLPSLQPDGDQWVEREREMERRERTRAEREWDRDKVQNVGPGKLGEDVGSRQSCSMEKRRKERKDKKDKTAEEPPGKLLDDLFNKTKAAPCIYWLPLTDEQFVQRGAALQERVKEREKRRKEQQEEDKKREEEQKEKMKASSGEGGDGDRGKEAERDRERVGERDRERVDERDRERVGERDRERVGERDRERVGERDRERVGERDRGKEDERDRERGDERDRGRGGGYRRPGGSNVGGGRRSRSRSDPPARDRRR
ncbi:hypothetical protein DPEC_G00061710 [Dallia pectoralis]|uniref:Uncharacterized protein n=1 Tax=Dallia pectoralis TaxID=75939 RepID=A0ACC2H7U5_DALPE|nr:hypothetical protein DPEC_G00061710 [Dallia pectoralis]